MAERPAVAFFNYRKSVASLWQRQSIFQSALHPREQIWRQAQPFHDALSVDGFDLLGDHLGYEREAGSALRDNRVTDGKARVGHANKGLEDTDFTFSLWNFALSPDAAYASV
jgi:hypothetical protein